MRFLPVLIVLLAATGAQAAQAPPRAADPVPANDPGTWFPADAYPPEAVAAGAQGRVVFLLDVDAAGRVAGCRIVTSSGTPVLDEATCQLARANARFRPATDAKKQPLAGTFRSGIRWALPQEPPAPVAAEAR